MQKELVVNDFSEKINKKPFKKSLLLLKFFLGLKSEKKYQDYQSPQTYNLHFSFSIHFLKYLLRGKKKKFNFCKVNSQKFLVKQ